MKDFFPAKTLHLLIEQAWLVETITKLGSGYLTHLAYQEGQVDPEVLTEIRNQSLGNDVLGEIIYSCGNSDRRVAVVEVAKVNDFQDFIRFDLRLLGVIPFIRDGLKEIQSRYLCYYHKNEHPA
jgi:hypothetical protein